MVREINRDVILLGRPSTMATEADLPIGKDLRDTLEAHKDGCVGMAANMIGEGKRIIAFYDEGEIFVFYNPILLKKEGPYDTEEGCLSLDGVRGTKRYKRIKVQYQNERMQIRQKTYTGWTAQIIQHEMDHLDGILI